MEIRIYPEDIVKLCLWDCYSYYIVGSEKEAEKILSENKEMVLSERDALIIGLLKVIETDNLIHKFNVYITELLSNRTIKDGSTLIIRKRVLDSSIDRFLEKFPEYWNCPEPWKNSLNDLKAYVEDIKNDISNLEIYKIEEKSVIYEFYLSNNIKKLLKFNYQ